MVKVAIVTPIFNDWESFRRLTEDVSTALKSFKCSVEFIAVDDCSTEAAPKGIPISEPVRDIRCVTLVSNMGHQRAIAIGLSTLVKRSDVDLVAVMDSDGEDTPLDLARLIKAAEAHPNEIIVAQRARRSEGAVFTAYYFAYRKLFSFLTGQSIDFGNFCVLPFEHASTLANRPETWNHFAATVVRSGLPIVSLPTARGKRYAGQSKMNFVNLVKHGLGAMSVFSETVLIRISLASGILLVLALLSIIAVAGIRFLTGFAIPGWTTNALGFLFLITMQAAILPLSMAFVLLNGRASVQLPPSEFAVKFIRSDRLISAAP